MEAVSYSIQEEAFDEFCRQELPYCLCCAGQTSRTAIPGVTCNSRATGIAGSSYEIWWRYDWEIVYSICTECGHMRLLETTAERCADYWSFIYTKCVELAKGKFEEGGWGLAISDEELTDFLFGE